MQEYFDITNGKTCDSMVRLMQLRLNSIRDTYHYNWEHLDPDGIYGPKTKAVVTAFQRSRGITPVSGILGPTTMRYIVEADTPRQLPDYSQLDRYYNGVKKGVKTSYDITSRTIGTAYKIDSVVNSQEKGIAFVLEKWEKTLNHQHEFLMRRLDKFPATKKMRARNVKKQLEFSSKFIKEARKYGINTAAARMGDDLTKENAIRYIQDIGDLISNSPLTKGIRALTKSLNKIKEIISPVLKFLNKIPGLKYFSVFEKMSQATFKMINMDFEGAFKLYLDALRELGEQLLVDAVVGAVVAIGGWIALVIALVVIIAVLLIDYFFFSDNPGESLSDKYLGIKTRNIVQDNIAPWAYDLVNK